VTGGPAGGTGATAGQALGAGIFLVGTSSAATPVTFSPAAGVTQTVSDAIADDAGNPNAEGGGGVSKGGSLVKSGGGTLVLAGDNTYSGGTSVTAGTLDVEGSVGAVSVSGGTLEGDGSTGQVTSTGGTVQPGNANPGTLTAAGLSLGSSSSFAVRLDGASAGSGYDQLSSSGPVRLGGATLSVSLGFTPSPGEVFDVVSNTSGQAVSGTFAGDVQGSTLTVAGGRFQVSYRGGASGHDVTLTYLGSSSGGGGGGFPFAPTATSVSLPTSSQNPSVAGQPVTLTITVSPVPNAGTVEFTDPGTTIGGCGAVAVNTASGQASCTTTFSAPGSYQVQAIYSGDSSYASSASPVLVQVVHAPGAPAATPTSTQVVSSAPRVVTGQQVTYTISVSGPPDSGLVKLLADGRPLPGCSSLMLHEGGASCQVVYGRPGHHLLQAIYTGDTRFAGSASATITETVAPSARLIGRPTARRGHVSFTIACATRSGGCQIEALLRNRAGARVGERRVLIAAGHRRGLAVALNAMARRLLARRGRLTVTLTVVLAVAGQRDQIATRTLTLRQARPLTRLP
jgi:autotransporter-associated beta strand protein